MGERQSYGQTCGGGARSLPIVAAAAAMLVLGAVWQWQSVTPVFVAHGMLLASYLMVGWPILWLAARNVVKGQVFDENFLMSIASLGAIAIGETAEAAAVMVFYAVGEYFQDKAVDNSRRSITALLNMRPEYVNLLTPAGPVRTSPESVEVGQRILVKPGERVPLDGVVCEGTSSLDTSALTGESLPRAVGLGDTALAGMVNTTGVFTLEVHKVYADSAVARILELVEQASERKAPTERFITTFARVYTPAVVVGAALVAVVPPLLLPDASFSEWLYRALVMLVISCPCALVVSVPLSYFGGIGAASRQGVLFKGANYLDVLANVSTVAFDKTGTLTHGYFSVVRVHPRNGVSEQELLAYAGALAGHSNHPISRAISQAHGKPQDSMRVEDTRELAGRGLEATVDGVNVLLGNGLLMVERGVTVPPAQGEESVVHLALGGDWLGSIFVADILRRETPGVIADLRRLGINKLWMLSGDRKDIADKAARDLALDGYAAELLPQDKVAAVGTLRETEAHSGGKLAFIGDGINDAPVLARADIGVAMGALGSDAAIEAADVVIMPNSLAKLTVAIRIARFTRRIVRQNIALSLGFKIGFMALGAAGLATIWVAVFADVGVALLAVLNATRALRYTGTE
ncbi:MAG: Zinc-transporting ATPase [Firmicutes bacterium]|nr:Zinc-transporting ATPase [candidate division NPL-UPA2 bacterium]